MMNVRAEIGSHLKMISKAIQIVVLVFLALLMVIAMVLANAGFAQWRVDVNMARQEAAQTMVDYTE